MMYRQLSRLLSPMGASSCFLLLLAAYAHADIIPASRRTTWNPGIPGGIPAVTTIHTTINGSIYGNGTTDATSAINNAIQAAGNTAASTGVRQVVFLPPGVYRVTSPVLLNRSNVVLRGAGSTLTRIILSSSQLTEAVRLGIFWPNYVAGDVVSVVGTVPKGATSITVANASAILVGDILQIDQEDDTSYVVLGDGTFFKRGPGSQPPANNWRSVGQQVRVVSKSGNTLGLAEPIHIQFDAAFLPQVFKTATFRAGQWGTHYTGLEDVYVSGGNNGNISMLNTAYSWIRNIESDGDPDGVSGVGTNGFHIGIDRAYRCEIRGNYIHHARSIAPGGGAYGIVPVGQSSENLIEDNITVMLNKPIVLLASGGGNVIGYNYADDALIGEGPAFVFQETAIDANHTSFSHYDLFEGNWSVNLGGDTTHGNSGWQTFFRNYAPGRNSHTPQYYQNIHGANATGWSRFYNYVGNVLAIPNAPSLQGFPPIYEHTWNGSQQVGNVFAWAAFRIGNSASPSGGNDNGAALATIYRHGNFDYISNLLRWEASNPDHALPNSLYLTAKPPFFGTYPWPWVDPVGPTKTFTLPAKARFEGQTAPPPSVNVGNATVQEGNGAVPVPSMASFTVSLSGQTALTALVNYATANGTATSGSDYTQTSGTVTFPPGATSAVVNVPIVGDLADEVDETFRLNLTTPFNAVLGDAQGDATIDDDDGPRITASSAIATEGQTGPSPLTFDLSLSASSPQTIAVSFATSDGTANAGADYTTVSGSITFPAGATSAQVVVNALGDSLDEPNETFALNLSGPLDATLGNESSVGRILDDDGGQITLFGLTHGVEEIQDLRAEGAQVDRDLYLVSQPPRTSWEVVIDEASGDLGNGQGPSLARVGSDLSTVIQGSAAVGTGPARQLRWRNTSSTAADGYVRVMSLQCSTDCGADDIYRIRAYETTGRISRFNQAGQSTVVVLQNTTSGTIAGDAYFWSGTGALLFTQAFNIPPRGTQNILLNAIPALANQSGSVTVSHNGPHGGLAGKGVTVDPVGGLAFDTPMLLPAR